jgi:hypothetical protein
MATKKEIRNVNIHINGKEVRNDIKHIGAEYKVAKNELAKLTIGSDAYNKKLAEVKKAKAILDEHRKSLGFVKSAWQKMKTGLTSLLPMLSLGTLVAGTKRLYEFVDGLKQSRAEVKKLSGLTGDALNNATSRAIAVADTYKKDFNEVLEATDHLSKQMGISFSESFDLIEKGFQAGADANGEFLENVREYPGFFKEADYSAEQFISTITKQAKSGIFSDKGIDAIKEATLSLREMTEPTKEAIEALGFDSDEMSQKISSGQMKMSDAIAMISKRMSELPEHSQAIGMALADIFKGAGEDAGVAFISTLSDVNTELEDMIDNNDDLVIAQQNNLIATTELNEAYLKMFGEGSELSKGWSGFKAAFATDLNNLSTILTDEDLGFWEKLGLLGNRYARTAEANAIKVSTAVKNEEQAYNLLNKQLVLMAENLGIEADLTNLTNKEIQELIDKKKAQIEAERNLAKAEDKRFKEAEKLHKKYLAAEKKLQNKIKEIREQLHLETLTDQAKEIQAVQNKYKKLFEEAKGHSEAIKELEELREQEIAAINKKHNDDKLTKRAEVEQKIQEMLLQGKDKEIHAIAKKYQELIKMAEEFGFDTSELFAQMNKEITKIKEGNSKEGDTGWIGEILGLSSGQTGELIENLATLLDMTSEELESWAEKWGNIGDAIHGVIDLANAYSSLTRANDEAEMQRFEKNMNSKKVKNQKLLDRGIISQEEYAQKAKQIDEQIDKKKADMMREQSEREKEAAYFSAIINTAAAIIGFLANPSGIAGVALSALAAITGGLQIAAISAQPVPAYEHGGYKDKEGLALLAEGNKKEGVLSNKILTDPTYGPMAEYLMDIQAGKSAVMPTMAIDSPDSSSVSRAMDYNGFQQSGGSLSQPVINNYYTTSSEDKSLDNTEFAENIKKLTNYMADPKNRQAYMNYDKQVESDQEMKYLNDLNNF